MEDIPTNSGKNVMTRFSYFISIIFILGSCQSSKEKTIEADLYFKLIDIERFFDVPDSTLIGIENLVHDINGDTLNTKRKEEFAHFKFMVDNNLLRKPFVWITLDDKRQILFLDSLDYNKLKVYGLRELERDKSKIKIKAVVREFEYPYYFHDAGTALHCVRILAIDKLSGETFWSK
jgi:hypothetical protein